MDRWMPDGGTPVVGPPDRQTLRLLARTCSRDSLVASTAFEPNAHEPRVLVVSLDAHQFPAPVEDARIDVRWYTTGDFSFHYVEADANGPCWECRWDRHPNPHHDRLHVHRPPDASAVEDLALPSTHPLDVSATVLAAVHERLERRWTDES